MSKAPTAAMDDALAATASWHDRLLHRLNRSAAYEWLLRRAITAWFLFLAYAMGSSLVERAVHLDLGPSGTVQRVGARGVQRHRRIDPRIPLGGPSHPAR